MTRLTTLWSAAEKPNPAETPKNIKKKASPAVACNVWLGSFSTAQAIAQRQGGSLLDVTWEL